MLAFSERFPWKDGCDMDFGPEGKDKPMIRTPAGNAYHFLTFCLVLGVLGNLATLRADWPDNSGRNCLQIIVQILGILLYVSFAMKCRGGAGFMAYLGMSMLGSVVINIILPPKKSEEEKKLEEEKKKKKLI
jgi:hypothetical protein